MVIQRLKPPVQNKLKAHYFDRYANSIEDAKVLSSVGDQSRPVQLGKCYETNAGAGTVSCTFPSNDHFNITNNLSYTISFWATYPSFGSAQRTEQGNFDIGPIMNDGNNIIYFGYSANSGSGFSAIQWQTRDASNNIFRLYVPNEQVPKNNYIHFAFVATNNLDGTINKEVYINGIMRVQHTVNVQANSVSAPTLDLKINKVIGLGSTKFGDFRIYREALTSTEILDIKDNKIISKTPVLWCKCDEYAGTKSYDSSGNNLHGTITNATLTTFHTTQDIYSFQNEIGYSTGKAFSIRSSDTITSVDEYGRNRYLSQEDKTYYFSVNSGVDVVDPDGQPNAEWSDGKLNLYRSSYEVSGAGSVFFNLVDVLQSNTFTLQTEIIQGTIGRFVMRDNGYYFFFQK